ncbi:ATP-binding protein [Pseudonocardia nematodicida]|uniref:ATP-binding protein n=1 Tax=Pseudonocardia nematodicida TaxID=1206997 RepID=A0ABV1KB93_9PSEU
MVDVPPIRSGFVQTSSGRVLVRAGPTNRAVIGEDLVAFVTERSTVPTEDRVVADATFDDLDEEVVRVFLRSRLSRNRVDLRTGLRDLGFLNEGRPTLACVLLFGKEPRSNRRRYGIDLLRFEGRAADKHVLRDRRQMDGRLPDLVDIADRAVYETMRRDAVVRGMIREEVPEYPPVAIREALLNAVGHRDYSEAGSAIQIRIFDDRVEIESPGALPGPVTIDNLKEAQYSRNARLMDTFHELDLVEEAGEGIGRIFDAMDEALLEAPVFVETAGGFVVQLGGGGALRAEDRLWLQSLHDLPPGPHGRVALVQARNRGSVSNEALRAARAMTSAEARETLHTLVVRGHLAARGTGRGTYYVLDGRAADEDSSTSPTDRMTAVVSHARRVGAVANRDVRGLLGISRVEALGLLDRAVAAGLLVAEGNRRARRYLPAPPQRS